MSRFYAASKSKHCVMWRGLRDDGYEIVSSWIDIPPSGEDDGIDFGKMWPTWFDEITSCDYLVAMHVSGEEWRGAFIEIGAMLSHGGTVLLVGDPGGSWVNHPNVIRCSTLYEALEAVSR